MKANGKGREEERKGKEGTAGRQVGRKERRIEGKKTGGQKDRQKDRQADRQTDKQTDRHPQPCSENKPFGNPWEGCLAAIKNYDMNQRGTDRSTPRFFVT